MDEFYDTAKAASRLDVIIQERRKIVAGQRGVFQLSDLKANTLDVLQVGARGFCVLSNASEEGGMEPTNFTQMKKSRPHMRQAVTLGGLGSTEFEKQITALETVYLQFYQHLPEGSLVPMEATTVSGHSALDVSCRYFTHRNAANGQGQEIISPLVDPDGVLTSLCDSEFLYTADNMVDYRARVMQENGTVKFEDCSPAVFKVGDIVEATVVFACIPTKDKRFKLTFLLKALMQINTEERNAAAVLRMRSRYPNFVRTAIPKRKPTYADDEEIQETQDRFCRMRIDTEVEDEGSG
ncbi:hypothetical protein CC1G_11347 [Coprinopsis cinerea okayama7|uniref:Uncharacterized protein n=1 Tax=Coprinopsis cinerea (strain Okayama-7 / 130 / ATCC MYA-4618 / FGSC 9003) TaxID=240176 RepID=A8P8U4_COPC7|nr:hypothetical protein CC1G_11347 [Coprinopsis cinerea okayama7\|eukprot:XP_001839636.2 hypothetical protein CC1G_11347 [Coprinopsis cinerea okayama7\